MSNPWGTGDPDAEAARHALAPLESFAKVIARNEYSLALVAAWWFAVFAWLLIRDAKGGRLPAWAFSPTFIPLVALMVVTLVLGLVAGWGLWRFRPWSVWATVSATVSSLLLHMLLGIIETQAGRPGSGMIMVILGTMIALPGAFFPWDQSAPLFSPAYAKVRAETQHIRVRPKPPRRVALKMLVVVSLLGGLIWVLRRSQINK
ncbi:MAG: hypothetical protein ACP5XB_01100 [Isosphaeraceae bacterium]